MKNPYDIEYWKRGTKIIEDLLEVKYRGDLQDAPFPLVGDQAALWLRAQAEAYRHALEMMGHSEVSPPEPIEEVTRYVMGTLNHDLHMFDDLNGTYVTYEDYKKLKKNLEDRDHFIVSMDMWTEFVKYLADKDRVNGTN